MLCRAHFGEDMCPPVDTTHLVSAFFTPDTIDKRTESSPTVTPFYREHNELDIYIMPAVTLLFRNMQHANSRNPMVLHSALEGMQYFVHVCLTRQA